QGKSGGGGGGVNLLGTQTLKKKIEVANIWFSPRLKKTKAAIESILLLVMLVFESRRRHTRCLSDWSSDVCSSDLRARRRRSSRCARGRERLVRAEGGAGL